MPAFILSQNLNEMHSVFWLIPFIIIAKIFKSRVSFFALFPAIVQLQGPDQSISLLKKIYI